MQWCRTGRRVAGASFACAVALPVVLLWPFRHAGPVADDYWFLSTSADVSLATFLSDWGHDLAPGVAGYRPIALLSYAIDRALWGGDVAGYHLTNYLLFGLTVALVGMLTRALTTSVLAGALASLLFAVHPIHHENVLWISGRTFLLAGLFYTAALLVASEPMVHRWKLAATGVLTATAVASYEGAITLPIAIFAIAIAASDRVSSATLRKAVLIAAPSAVVVAVYLVLRWGALSDAGSEVDALRPLKVFGNTGALVERLGGVGLHRSIASSRTFLAAAALMVLTIPRGRTLPRTRETVVFGAALIGIGFLPFAPLHGFTDRFGYVSSIGFVMAIAAGIWGALRSHRWRRIAVGVLIVATAGGWTRQLILEARDWVEAGHIAATIRREVQSAVPDPEPGSTMWVVNVPKYQGVAYVFPTYFEHAQLLAYGRNDFTVVGHYEEEGFAPAPILMKAAGSHDAVLIWYRGTRQVERVHPRAPSPERIIY